MSHRPAFKTKRFINIPILYILVGALMAGIGLPLLTPSGGKLSVLIIERASEIIVIISLVGAASPLTSVRIGGGGFPAGA